MLNPPFRGKFSRTARSPGVTKGGTIYYPIWLAYATGVLEEQGFRVWLMDAPAEGRTVDDVLRATRKISPRLIVLDTSTPSIFSDIAVAGALKARFPESFVVLVGTHVSALPDEAFEMSGKIDAVARREYDYTIRDLALVLRDGGGLESVSGLTFPRHGSLVHNPDRPFIEKLDDLPFVTRVFQRHLKLKNYYFAAARHPMVMIMTGRGCPYRCTFCVYPQTFHGRRYRRRSPENVVDEFQWVVRNLPRVREIGIEDDTFTADRGRVQQICELILARNIRIPWYCNVRPDLDHELLRIMKKAGCRLVTIGFESGSQAVLDAMHKGLRIDGVRRFMEHARKAKMLVHGCIVIGHPGETRDTIRASLRFAKELQCDSMQFYPLYVYPGTEAFESAKQGCLLETTDYSRWVTAEGHHNCVVNLPGLPAKELIRICDEAYLDYHFSPFYLWRKIRQGFGQPAEGIRTARSALNYVKSLRRGKAKIDQQVQDSARQFVVFPVQDQDHVEVEDKE
jgi:anaerobic magnesium-protoporphyrin IX monomethyl ester cyclase